MNKFFEKIKEFAGSIKEKVKRFITAFKMNGEVKKKTYIIGGCVLVVILLIVFLCLLLPGANKDNKKSDVIESTDTDLPRIEPEPVVEPKNLKSTMEEYEDVYAWIEIPGTKEALSIENDCSYPIAQHPDDRFYYLDVDLDGNKSAAGTLFTEKECEGKPMNNKDFTDPVTVIYGHNMANRTMFGGMQTYLSKMDFSEPHYIYIYQEGRRLTYLIVGGMQYDTSHILYYHETFTLGGQQYLLENGLAESELEIAKESDWNSFFDGLKADTDAYTNYDKENWVEYGDKVIILATCKNGDASHRYLIIAKLIEDTDDPTTWEVDTAALMDEKNGKTSSSKSSSTKSAAKSSTPTTTSKSTKTKTK